MCDNFVLPLLGCHLGRHNMGTAPIIAIFVGHSAESKYAGDEFFRRCNCRKHLRWTKDRAQHRRPAGTRCWEEAERIKCQIQDQVSGRSLDTPPEDNIRTWKRAPGYFSRRGKYRVSHQVRSESTRENLTVFGSSARSGRSRPSKALPGS